MRSGWRPAWQPMPELCKGSGHLGRVREGGRISLELSAVLLAETPRRCPRRSVFPPHRTTAGAMGHRHAGSKYLEESSKPGMHRWCADVRPMGVRDWWALRDSNPPPLPCKRRPARSPDLGKQSEMASQQVKCVLNVSHHFSLLLDLSRPKHGPRMRTGLSRASCRGPALGGSAFSDRCTQRRVVAVVDGLVWLAVVFVMVGQALQLDAPSSASRTGPSLPPSGRRATVPATRFMASG